MSTIQTIFLLELPDAFEFKSTLLFIVIVFGAYAFMKATSRSIKVVDSHWHTMFETRPFSSLEFYELLKKLIQEKEISGLDFFTVSHSERGILSAKRIYMRVKFREYMMDICAAPFAMEGFFVSWWLGNAGFTLRDFLVSIPTIGKLFSRREKTFYEMDTEIMFKETIARCVKNAIEKLTEPKGLRLDMSDWRGSELKPNN